jgi:hypothetical protein
MGMGTANCTFLTKMNKLANKYFRGVLTDESLTRLNIYVKHLQYGMNALYVTLKTDEMTLPVLLKYAESFTKESFEHMDHWNWILTRGDEQKLIPFQERDLVVEEEITSEQNHGVPSWIHIGVGSCDSDCEDEDEYEETLPKVIT